MDFKDTPDEAKFRTEVRAFIDEHLTPLKHAFIDDLNHDVMMLEYARAWQRVKAENGFACITWPAEYGGRDASAIEQIILSQEESRAGAPVTPFLISLGLCLPTILACGNDDQKKRYIEKALRGEEIWCQLFSEPGAGSDLAAVRTKAKKDGDTWILEGQKVWTSLAHVSDFGLLLARTDPSVPKHAGLTMFLVDMKSPGVDIRPIHQASGSRDFNEVYFDRVRVSDENRLGDVGQGWRVALVTLMNERATFGESAGPGWPELLALGEHLDMTGDSAFQEKFANAYVGLRGFELTTFRTLTALSRGETPGPESSIGKLLTSNLAQDLCHQAIEWQGHFGIIMDADLAYNSAAFQHYLFWAASLRIAGGTDEILRNIIAERVLGLPTEPRQDKDVPFNQLG